MPSASHSLITIPFHGSKLIAQAGETPSTTFVAMKPIVEGMGMDWEPQRKKLERHPVLNTCTSVMAVQISADDQVREHTFLSLDRINFWLATIHPDRVKDPAVRAKVIDYQTECSQVLFNHCFGEIFASDLVDAEEDISEALAPIKAQIESLTAEVRSLIVSHPVGVSVCDGKTAKEWLVEYGCKQKGRNPVVRKVSADLRDLALRHGIVIDKCARTGTWVFPSSLGRPYMESAGRVLVKQHNAGKPERQTGLDFYSDLKRSRKQSKTR